MEDESSFFDPTTQGYEQEYNVYLYCDKELYQTHLFKAADSLSNVSRQLLRIYLLAYADKELLPKLHVQCIKCYF